MFKKLSQTFEKGFGAPGFDFFSRIFIFSIVMKLKIKELPTARIQFPLLKVFFYNSTGQLFWSTLK